MNLCRLQAYCHLLKGGKNVLLGNSARTISITNGKPAKLEKVQNILFLFFFVVVFFLKKQTVHHNKTAIQLLMIRKIIATLLRMIWSFWCCAEVWSKKYPLVSRVFLLWIKRVYLIQNFTRHHRNWSLWFFYLILAQEGLFGTGRWQPIWRLLIWKRNLISGRIGLQYRTCRVREILSWMECWAGEDANYFVHY